MNKASGTKGMKITIAAMVSMKANIRISKHNPKRVSPIDWEANSNLLL